MTIHEPATLATDYLLAAVAAWLARRLHLRLSRTAPAARWWSWTLAAIAASALVGGSYHGFAPEPPTKIFALWWLATLWLVSLTSAAMTVSWIHAVVPPRWHRLGFAAVAAKLLVFAAIAASRPVFAVVVFDYGSSILLWLGAALLLRRNWSAWMVAAIALTIVATLVQQLRLAPSAHFNHNDLYHVIQTVALVAFYRAARQLAPSPSGAAEEAVD